MSEMVEITSPDGQQRGLVLSSTVAAWVRNGWTVADTQPPTGSSFTPITPAVDGGVRDDSAATLEPDGQAVDPEE